jgi:release factor glutamine methyltransferase
LLHENYKGCFYNLQERLNNVYDANEAEAITLLVISEICGLSKAKIKAFPKFEISIGQSERLTGILNELKTGKPVQYILGTTEFYGLPFNVNPSVLIPRPETEELVEWALKTIREADLDYGAVLDIGTGSGCIAISLKKNLPGFKVSAVDISVKALATATENAKLNEVDMEFINADILSSKPGVEIPYASIIISNPPYVTMDDKSQMHANVTNFEPHLALFVPENNPLIFYKAIASFAVEALGNYGILFFEINEAYGNEVVEMLADIGFNNIELRQDMNGKYRMVRAALSSSSIYRSTDD